MCKNVYKLFCFLNKCQFLVNFNVHMSHDGRLYIFPLCQLPDDVNVDNLYLDVLSQVLSHATLLAGVCHALLKPVKAAMTKRGKKKKETLPPLVNHFVKSFIFNG